MDTFKLLSNDEIIYMALYLSINDINNYCLASKRFNDIICKNQNFWRTRLQNDYKIYSVPNNISPKEYYQDIKTDLDNSKEKESLIFTLVKYGLFDQLKITLKDYPSYNVALISAIMYNRLNIVKYLIDIGADPASRYGIIFPVVAAATTGNIEMLNYLIERGATLKTGAIHEAARAGKLQMVKYLIEKMGLIPDDYTMTLAITEGHIDMVKYLLDYGIPIYDYQNSYVPEMKIFLKNYRNQ